MLESLFLLPFFVSLVFVVVLYFLVVLLVDLGEEKRDVVIEFGEDGK